MMIMTMTIFAVEDPRPCHGISSGEGGLPQQTPCTEKYPFCMLLCFTESHIYELGIMFKFVMCTEVYLDDDGGPKSLEDVREQYRRHYPRHV